MASDQAGGVKWRQIAVLIRSDIFDSAKKSGIDISSECNRALAARTGIDFSQQQIPEPATASPVIIAKEHAAGRGGAGALAKKSLNPVLNAEDPEIRSHLKNMKKDSHAKPAPLLSAGVEAAEAVHPGSPKPDTAAVPSSEPHIPGKAGKKPGPKKGKDSLIRQFVAKRVQRTDTGDGDRVAKDELYQVFVRWWNTDAGRPGTVPDKRAFTVALKNRFAMEESTANGVQFWKNARLR